ncbi:MarR family winged helix-turn-helix transcriptional regulator [Corynebacterium lubricantis]|uniref:MarR family winged helix-turn-helix transcriptional regulator n=1 Tax=Corynebacterium lubricantis TaxID=541095 RepID=UPI00035E72AE|nr:MarR family winged helix-turn-helix transcriptional regulator [Corynebacterium lubricantis]
MSEAGSGQQEPVTSAWPLEHSLGYLLRRSINRLSTAWSHTGPALTMAQFTIMIELDRNPGLDQHTLSENVWIDSSTVADVCRRLVQQNILERTRSETDRRRYILTLTAEGKQQLRDALPKVTAVNEELATHLNEKQQRELVALLRQSVGLE